MEKSVRYPQTALKNEFFLFVTKCYEVIHKVINIINVLIFCEIRRQTAIFKPFLSAVVDNSEAKMWITRFYVEKGEVLSIFVDGKKLRAFSLCRLIVPNRVDTGNRDVFTDGCSTKNLH